MTLYDMQTVPCPCCNKVLYRLVLKQAEGGGDAVWLTTTDSPRVEDDKQGYFIKCPHCSKRVAMIEVPGIPGTSFEVSPDQKCNQTLP